MKNLELELYPQAIKLWGIKNQLDMLAEELFELGVCVMHLSRKHKNKTSEESQLRIKEFIKECADVKLTMNNIIYYFNLEQKIDEQLLRNLVGLSTLINECAEH